MHGLKCALARDLAHFHQDCHILEAAGFGHLHAHVISFFVQHTLSCTTLTMHHACTYVMRPDPTIITATPRQNVSASFRQQAVNQIQVPSSAQELVQLD